MTVHDRLTQHQSQTRGGFPPQARAAGLREALKQARLQICRNPYARVLHLHPKATRAIDVLRSAQHHLHSRGQSLDAAAARYLPAPSTFERELTERLTPAHRELIELVYFQGYTYVEAAHHLGLPLGMAKTRARAALLALSKLAR